MATSNTKPCIQCIITIDSANKYLDVTSVAGGDETVTLIQQDYADIHALCAAIQTGLQELGDDWDAATCTVGQAGLVVIDSRQIVNAVAIEWSTGANSAYSIGEVLGFDVSSDDTGDYTYASDAQHKYGWYPNKWPRMYGPLNPKGVGGEQKDTLSGSHSKTVHVAMHHYYDIEYTRLPPEYVYNAEATGADLNKDLEHVWEEMIQGKVCRLFEDASDSGTYLSLYLKSPRDWAGAVTRPHIDYKAYNIKMRFRQQES